MPHIHAYTTYTHTHIRAYCMHIYIHTHIHTHIHTYIHAYMQDETMLTLGAGRRERAPYFLMYLCFTALRSNSTRKDLFLEHFGLRLSDLDSFTGTYITRGLPGLPAGFGKFIRVGSGRERVRYSTGKSGTGNTIY